MVYAVLLAAYTGGLLAQANRLGPKVAGHLALFCIQHIKRLNSCISSAMMTRDNSFLQQIFRNSSLPNSKAHHRRFSTYSNSFFMAT